MIMRIILLLLSLFLLLNTQVNCQRLPEPVLCGSRYEMPAGYLGSQYFTSKWVKGDVLLHDGSVVTNQQLRYNGFLDELIWNSCDTCFEVRIDKGLTKGFILKPIGLPEAKFVKLKVKPDVLSDSAETYGQELYSGKVSCYALRKIVIRGYTLMGAGGSSYILENLEQRPEYLLVFEGGQQIRISKISRRRLLNSLPVSLQPLALQIVSKENFRLRDEESLIKFVKLMAESE